MKNNDSQNNSKDYDQTKNRLHDEDLEKVTGGSENPFARRKKPNEIRQRKKNSSMNTLPPSPFK